jgi:integrase
MNSLVPFGGGDLLLKEQVDHIELHEVETLKRACDIAYERSKQTENYKWIRDKNKLFLQLMWATGARVSDVTEINTTKINYREKTVTFLVHKRKSKKVKTGGEFWHTIGIDMDTLTMIMDYVQTWEIKGLLFPSLRGSNKAITRQAINKLLNGLTELAGTRHIHPHMFRHGIAMHLQSQGVPAELIAYHLAHSSTAITLKTYARMDAKQERAMFENLNVKFW